MTLVQLPLIYNVDKLRIYDNHLLKVEQWLGAQSIGWYARECEPIKEYANRKIEDMAISVEGCLSEVIVIEIFFK